jgi:hypothetical protein
MPKKSLSRKSNKITYWTSTVLSALLQIHIAKMVYKVTFPYTYPREDWGKLDQSKIHEIQTSHLKKTNK